jgi:hypothetical protein
MKKLVLIAAISLLLATLMTLSAAPYVSNGQPENKVEVLQSRDKNLFIFRADKNYLGATVEIVTIHGKSVATQQLRRRKMIVDFSQVPYGEYIVRIRKGDEILEYGYVKE